VLPPALCTSLLRLYKIGVAGTQEFGAQNFLVELNVVRHEYGRLLDAWCDLNEDGLEIDPVLYCLLGGDAVNLCGILGYGEPVRLDDVLDTGDFVCLLVGQ